jgi:Raf kinase inhibitor-like YbhB/YbcL family protein
MKRTAIASAAVAAIALELGCASPALPEQGKPVEGVPAAPATAPTTGGDEMQKIDLTSSAFEPGGEIPAVHTCQGDDLSVPLAWSGVPEGTKSLALIVDDPDAPDPAAPKMTWVHWVLYDLPPDCAGLSAGVKELPRGTREGQNDWKRTGYGGPCPPIGRHRYFHKLYALEIVLPDLGRPTKDQLLAAMEGHVLAAGELIGTYRKR